MTTIRELVRDISFRLHSYTGIREQVTYLTSPIDADDTTLQVSNGARISRGLIEVDDELMLVEEVEGNEVKIYPFGRGREGSVATSHAVNTEVTNDPQLPKQSIFQAVRDTIVSLHPDLFQVKRATFVFNPAQFVYELPADVDRILEVTFDIPGPTGQWPRMYAWKFLTDANVDRYPSGKAIELGQAAYPGFTVQVTYAAPYGTPTSMDDTLESLGVQASVQEIVWLGTAWRATQILEPSRLTLQSVENMARAESVPPGAITNLARQWFAQFTLRKDEERRRLLTLHEQQIHRTW